MENIIVEMQEVLEKAVSGFSSLTDDLMLFSLDSEHDKKKEEKEFMNKEKSRIQKLQGILDIVLKEISELNEKLEDKTKLSEHLIKAINEEIEKEVATWLRKGDETIFEQLRYYASI